MCPLIRKLEPLVASQIAAGEVVERPASVVKELVENSIDAGATRISVEIMGGGMDLIRVSDDGTGMSREDALSAIERFATSKIRSLSDLENIDTLGFRGEALPSIASCSKFTIETQPKGAGSGTSLYVQGGTVVETSDKGLPPGTTITVEDLFFNTPARLKFMKSESRERNVVIETVERLALAWPFIGFTLSSQGKIVFHTPGNGLKNAVANIFGPETVESVAKVSHEYDKGLKIEGFIGMPRLYRRTRDRQIFSVNRRPVRNPMLGWALDSAYEGLLPPKTYPVAVLEITIDPEQVDVNVHPTKAEIKFRNEKEIRKVVTESVRQALSQAGYLGDVYQGLGHGHTQYPSGPETMGPAANTVFQHPTGPGMSRGQTIRSWHARESHYSSNLFRDLARPNSSPAGSTAPDSHRPHGLPEGWEYLGSLEDTYLVAKTQDSLLIIDQHALAESLAYASLLKEESGSQELLMPEIIALEPKEAALYEEYAGTLEKVGFSTRAVGTRTISVTRVPLILGKPLPPDSLKEILLSFHDEPDKDASPERMLAKARIATAACHGSVRGNQPLTREEALALIKELWANPSARTCPHGRPTVQQILYSEVKSFFGR